MNNWCEPHIVNSPPPLAHPERGHSAAKIKQICIVLLIHPQRAKAKGIAVLSTEDGCSPSPLQTPGTGLRAWHHTNPAMWLLEQNQVMFSQERRSAKNAAACTTMPLDTRTACVFRSNSFFLRNYEK